MAVKLKGKDDSTAGDSNEFATFQYVAQQVKVSIETAKEQLSVDIKKEVQESLLKEQNEIKAAVDKTRNTVLASLALFASFFSFLSVNISIFSRINDLSLAAWFMLLMLACLLVFISVFFLFLFASEKKVGWFWAIPLLIFILAIVIAASTGLVVQASGENAVLDSGVSKSEA